MFKKDMTLQEAIELKPRILAYIDKFGLAICCDNVYTLESFAESRDIKVDDFIRKLESL